MQYSITIKTAIIAIAISAMLGSCKKTCNCSAAYNSTTVYVPGNTVNYAGTCYEAINQGGGVTPGPWMQNGNDVWKVCNSN